MTRVFTTTDIDNINHTNNIDHTYYDHPDLMYGETANYIKLILRENGGYEMTKNKQYECSGDYTWIDQNRIKLIQYHPHASISNINLFVWIEEVYPYFSS